MRQTRAEIDLGALESNYRLIKRLTGGSVKVSAVVKGNAYGHGLIGVSKKLEALKVDSFCLAYAQEAIILRENGITTPILIIGPIFDEDYPLILQHKLTPTIYDFETLDGISKLADKNNSAISIHIKIDSGMNRLGFKPGDLSKLIEKLSITKNLLIEGLSSHFFESDNEDQTLTKEQFGIFNKLSKEIETKLKIKTIRHICNSGGITAGSDFHLDMVRPGLMLYGYMTTKNVELQKSLKKVLTLKSEISTIKNISKGEHVGYSRGFKADKNYTIGVVPIGYADGYLKKYSNLGYVLVRGEQCKVLGSICMDMIFCDLSKIDDPRAGDEIILLGSDGKNEINAVDYAKACGTIPYEILTSIIVRVPRVYKD